MLDSTTKKARLCRTWSGAHPVWCAWQVTYRCNFRCRFCNYWRDPLGSADEASVDDFARGARKLASFGSMLVSLAGGEPFIRRDLPDVARAIGEYHLVFVTTNGWFITPDVARDIMRAGVWGVSVSIDYASPDRHDRRRGKVGAWKRAWKAVELLAAARVHNFQRVNVLAVLMEDNLDDFERLLEMAARREAYFMVQPYGQIKTGSPAHVHNDGPVVPRLLELHRRYRNFLSNAKYLSRFDEYLARGIGGCRAGRGFFNIDSVGDVAICVEHKSRPVANVYRDSAHAIRDRLRRAARGNTCKACWYNCRGEIESLYRPWSLLLSLPTYLFDRGPARGKMGRWW